MSELSPIPVLKRKLVAILRGIKPQETRAVVASLIEAGFEAIEIPLNSPQPFQSLEIAVRAAEELAPGSGLIGSGTVLTPEDVTRVAECGGKLVVSPNADPAVIAKTRSLSMVSMPGVYTAGEAFIALNAGASALKFFPASSLGPSGINAISAVLPTGTDIYVVGGISETDFAGYAAVNIRGFGLGSSLYSPGRSPVDIGQRAKQIVEIYDSVSPA